MLSFLVHSLFWLAIILGVSLWAIRHFGKKLAAKYPGAVAIIGTLVRSYFS